MYEASLPPSLTLHHLTEPTGLLVDSAMKLLLELMPEVSVEKRRNAFLRASKYALTKGVTTVVDFGRYFPGAPLESSWQDFSGDKLIELAFGFLNDVTIFSSLFLP